MSAIRSEQKPGTLRNAQKLPVWNIPQVKAGERVAGDSIMMFMTYQFTISYQMQKNHHL